jgi:MinD superfamily P-loop ATPase
VSDLERILKLCGHFKLPARVVINKWDLNEEMCGRIEDVTRTADALVIGRIPYDEGVMDTITREATVIEAGPRAIAEEIRAVWRRVSYEIDTL